jgi:hypothetical protein
VDTFTVPTASRTAAVLRVGAVQGTHAHVLDVSVLAGVAVELVH